MTLTTRPNWPDYPPSLEGSKSVLSHVLSLCIHPQTTKKHRLRRLLSPKDRISVLHNVIAAAAAASAPSPTATLRTDAPTSPQRPLTLAFKETHGNTIRPVTNSGKGPKDRFEGKMGVLLAPNSPGGGTGSQKLLTLSTHVLSSFAAATKASLRESKDWMSTTRLTSASSGEEVKSDLNTFMDVREDALSTRY